MIPWWTSLALAQSAPAVDGAVPVPHLTVGGERLVWTDDTAPGDDGRVVARALGSYAHRPLVWEGDDGTTEAVLGAVWQVDAIVAGGWGPARLGVDVPVLAATSDTVTSGRAGLGDVAVDARVTVLDPRRAPLGLAAAARLGVPTGTVDVPLGADRPTWELTAVADRTVGPVLLAGNLGLGGGPELQLGSASVGDHAVWRLGAGWEASVDVGLSAELAGRVAWSGPPGSRAPTEALLGGWAWLTESVAARVGVGTGVGRAVGTPAVRGLLGVVYEPPRD